jgi:hypothetical protein
MLGVVDTDSERKKLVTTIAAASIGMGLLVILAGEQDRPLFANWTTNISASTAVAFAALVSIRQGVRGLYGSAHAMLAAGLGLSLAAELLWTYYQLGLGIDVPSPSLADALWLAGYGPIAFYLLRLYNFFGRGRPAVAAAVSLGYAAFVAYLAIFLIAEATSKPEYDVMALAVSISYPALDGLLIVPCILVLVSLRHGRLTATPWALLSSAILLIAAADSGFAYYPAAGLDGQAWVWDILFNAGYIAVAATLFWHKRFFIFDNNKLKKMWQGENR